MRAIVGLVALGAFGLSVVACSPSPEDASKVCFGAYLGDAKADPKLEITYLDENGDRQSFQDGGSVSLTFPPQGGRVLFIGARVTNIDPCGATITGAIRDTTNQKVQLDQRTINLLPTGDGWGESAPTDIASFANIPACPNNWSATNLYDGTYELVVVIEDKAGKKVTVNSTIKPFCGEPENETQCRCICRTGYMLGDACP